MLIKGVAYPSVKEFDLAKKLARFNVLELTYVENKINLEIKHIKSGLGFLTNLLDNFNILPLLIYFLFTVYIYIQGKTFTFNALDIVVYISTSLYLVAILFAPTTKVLEKHALILSTALQIKHNKKITRSRRVKRNSIFAEDEHSSYPLF